MDKDPKKHIQPEHLLGQLEARTQPDKARTQLSKAAVKQRWLKAVQQKQQQRRQRFQWAMAASVLLLVTLTLVNMNNVQPDAQSPWAQVLAASGDISVRQPGQAWQAWQGDENLTSGAEIKTSAGSHLTLELADHSYLSLAENTQISTNEDAVALHGGQLYHDTDEATKAAPLTISTAYGSIRHIGTRYLVSQNQEAVTVAVRSGAVAVSSAQPGEDTRLQAEQQTRLSAQGTSEVVPVSQHDPMWDWTFKAQPDFDLQNKSLHDFIQWYARQTGLEVDWEGLESQSKRVRLQGNISNMTAEQAIQTVFLTTSYQYNIEQGRLHISQQKK
jgi:ferric-dicitrate binding protein FerR (iron transport regulator)